MLLFYLVSVRIIAATLMTNIDIHQYLPVIASLLPGIFGTLAASLAGFLRQDKWNRFVNEGIVALFIIVAAVLNTVIAGKITGNWSTDVNAVQASLTVLLAQSLRPLTLYLQSNTLVKDSDATLPRTAAISKTTNAAAPPIRVSWNVSTPPSTNTTDEHSG